MCNGISKNCPAKQLIACGEGAACRSDTGCVCLNGLRYPNCTPTGTIQRIYLINEIINIITLDIEVHVTLQHNISCNGGNDGEVKATILGGIAPYEYQKYDKSRCS